MVSTFSPDLTMAELLEVYPGAQRALFKQYHIGGCSSCGFTPSETLAEVCARNENLSAAEVIDYLEKSQIEDEKSLISPAEVRLHWERTKSKFWTFAPVKNLTLCTLPVRICSVRIYWL